MLRHSRSKSCTERSQKAGSEKPGVKRDPRLVLSAVLAEMDQERGVEERVLGKFEELRTFQEITCI